MKVSDHTLQHLGVLGERIKKARIENNMSQVELGERIGVTRYTVGAMESGRAKVAIGTVFEAAFVVGLQLPCGKNDENLPASQAPNNPSLVTLDDDYF